MEDTLVACSVEKRRRVCVGGGSDLGKEIKNIECL
jgi:hypothetical protein